MKTRRKQQDSLPPPTPTPRAPEAPGERWPFPEHLSPVPLTVGLSILVSFSENSFLPTCLNDLSPRNHILSVNTENCRDFLRKNGRERQGDNRDVSFYLKEISMGLKITENLKVCFTRMVAVL